MRHLRACCSGSKGGGAVVLMAVETVSGDPKNAHLCRLDGAAGNLRLFKADVLHPDALAAAVAGCEGVFHAASPVPSVKVADPEASTYLTRSSSFDFVPGVFFRTRGCAEVLMQACSHCTRTTFCSIVSVL